MNSITCKCKQFSIFIIFFLLFESTYSQYLLRGYVLNRADSTSIELIKIFNKNTGKTVYSDEKGYFKIEVHIADSILIESYYFEKLVIHIKKEQIDQVQFVYLNEKTFDLDEVHLIPFNEEQFNSNFKKELLSDINKQYYLYQPEPNYNFNFIKAIPFIIKTISKKEEVVELVQLNYERLELLLKDETVFPPQFLSQTLEISEAQTSLFLSYIESKNFQLEESELKNPLMLIEIFITSADEFKILSNGNID